MALLVFKKRKRKKSPKQNRRKKVRCSKANTEDHIESPLKGALLRSPRR
jgi:hypothetical protein